MPWSPATHGQRLKQQRGRAKDTRPSAAKRGYGRRWRKRSKQFLQTHPLCKQCSDRGKVVAAVVVDHINPHKGDDESFWNEENWQGLCVPCHNAKSPTE